MSRAMMIHEDEPRLRLTHPDTPSPAQGEVVVDIEYSALNYKDALALTGEGRIIRQYPLIGGIDATGIVRDSQDERFAPGDRVIATGWGIGEQHSGGFTTCQCFKGDWLVHCPDTLSPENAMLAGTAGFTAMQALTAIEHAGVTPNAGPLLVTGATGGVGQWAVLLLAQAGFEVHAVTGKGTQHEPLKALGATEVIDRHDFTEKYRPLDKARWAGGIDAVGGVTLSALLSRIKDNGAVAAVGLAGGMELNMTVAPFILRGVSLLGINSVSVPFEQRQGIWQRLAGVDATLYQPLHAGTLSLEELAPTARRMIDGETQGRYLVDPGQA